MRALPVKARCDVSREGAERNGDATGSADVDRRARSSEDWRDAAADMLIRSPGMHKPDEEADAKSCCCHGLAAPLSVPDLGVVALRARRGVAAALDGAGGRTTGGRW